MAQPVNPAAPNAAAGSPGVRPDLGGEPVTVDQVAADPLLVEIAEVLSSIYLHIGTYPVTQLTTRQRELFFDMVDADHTLDPSDPDSPPWLLERWWREGYIPEQP